MCAAVLAWVGSGKRGREVRAHFSDPPFGWPRDAIDGALISLFGTGHLRASTNGVALTPKGLDQSKVPSTDFRVRVQPSAPASACRRASCSDRGIDCKRNEEVTAAGRFLDKLVDLAATAGGEPPLPEPPDTRPLTELPSLAGNEQLSAIVDRSPSWRTASRPGAGQANWPASACRHSQRLQALLRHADGLDAAADVELQTSAIVKAGACWTQLTRSRRWPQ